MIGLLVGAAAVVGLLAAAGASSRQSEGAPRNSEERDLRRITAELEAARTRVRKQETALREVEERAANAWIPAFGSVVPAILFLTMWGVAAAQLVSRSMSVSACVGLAAGLAVVSIAGVAGFVVASDILQQAAERVRVSRNDLATAVEAVALLEAKLIEAQRAVEARRRADVEEFRRTVEAVRERQRRAAEQERQDDEDRQRREREAMLHRQREAQKLREQQQRIARFNLVRDAIVWVRHLSADLDAYVAVNWIEILEDRDGMVRRYHDPNSPIGTAERCGRLAHWFLGRFPGEAHYLVPEEQRNAEWLAHALRVFHGREIELMVPRAMAVATKRALKDQSPTQAPDPAVAIAEDLPPEAAKLFQDAQDVSRVEEAAHRLVAGERARLMAEGLRDEIVEQRVEALRRRLDIALAKFRRTRGFVQ